MDGSRCNDRVAQQTNEHGASSSKRTETISKSMDESISTTIASIYSVLQQLDATGDFSIFLSREIVVRPPFPFFYGLVELIDRAKPSLGWKKLLIGKDLMIPSTRKEKLGFISRLLTVVSNISNYRYDIFVSPPNILCGKDVGSTHQFIRAIANAAQASPDEMNKLVTNVLKEGDSSLYKRSVRARWAFKRLQALVRGWLTRKQYCTMTKTDNSDEDIPIDSIEQVTSGSIDVERSEDEFAAKAKAQSELDDFLKSYNDMLSHKDKVEDELKSTEEILKREKDKLVRVLNIGIKHKNQQRLSLPASSLSIMRPPYSAPSDQISRCAYDYGDKKVAYHLPRFDEAFVERITNLSITQNEVKKKIKRIEERERALKQRMSRSKQKELELKHHEQRVSDLAEKIRRQKLQLKEQKSKLAAPPSPGSTSRPCSLCREKEIQLRKMKNEVKHRMKLLSKREAEVIGRARALKKREVKISQIQNDKTSSEPTKGSTNETLHEPKSVREACQPPMKDGENNATSEQTQEKMKM